MGVGDCENKGGLAGPPSTLLGTNFMPCYHPMQAFMSRASYSNGFKREIKFNLSFQKAEALDMEPVKLPCGQCVGCRERRARDWAIRCMHEASLYERNCFITLTYNDEHLPPARSLVYDDFQKFMKRLRKAHKGHQPLADGTYPIRFYMAGEYGENFGRPHFHACLFNFDFDDKRFFKDAPGGQKLFTSAALQELWTFGYSSVGSVTFQSAAYVARYINKKVTGDLADDHYSWVDPETGEIHWRTPEFNKMSLKPGIGSAWLDKYQSDVFPRDYVIHKGAKLPVPRYYNKKFECSNPFEWDEVKFSRLENAKRFLDDNTPERLLVKKQVKLAQLSRLKRTLT